VLEVTPEVLRAQLVEQCSRLATQAQALGVALEYAKPHGSLYHHANQHPPVAQAVVSAVREVLGPRVIFIGPASGALREAAREAGLTYAREGFADRGTLPDGSLIRRGEPGLPWRSRMRSGWLDQAPSTRSASMATLRVRWPWRARCVPCWTR
jgi:UPF0271 protein